ncbi:hypothetical protein ACZ90_38385 [Streptomyces albus subsp. albus]|nr:hypothetical protein ACZ90_38385 [Streptomyces albus subsp. albus]
MFPDAAITYRLRELIRADLPGIFHSWPARGTGLQSYLERCCDLSKPGHFLVNLIPFQLLQCPGPELFLVGVASYEQKPSKSSGQGSVLV